MFIQIARKIFKFSTRCRMAFENSLDVETLINIKQP